VISDWAVAGPVPLVRKAYVTTGEGWDEGLRIDDWDFFLRIAAHGALGFIDEPVCAYRVHSSNTCRTSDVLSRIKNLQESRRVAQKHVKKFKGVYRRMLQAQCFLIGAKIAFLKRRWLTACFYMTAYMVLTAVGKFKA
jgi:hypothetical protein